MNQSYWLALLGHDAYAALFQSVDQYRSALIERASSPRAQPEPAGPSHWDVCQWLEQQGHWGDNAHRIPRIANMVQGALTRYTRPTIEPLPVAERLPGPEDCDAEGRCWWLTLAVADGGRGGYSTFWELTTFKAAVRCASHWLPHNALPVPGAEVPPMPELRAASAEAQPAGGLVERVAMALDSSCPQDEYVINDCRAAIREVAAFLEAIQGQWCDSAAEVVAEVVAELRREADRG
jgi:hypothetical protein